MSIIYSDDDPVSGRWSGVNRLLTAYEVNYNFYQHETRIATLEANYTLTVSLASISQPTASSLLFTLTDASTQGPFEMPVAAFRDRGAWTVNTAYLVNDTFTANGGLYRALFDHTSSATSFSPAANDGAGHDYYAAMLASPGNALPTGGATGTVLQKSSGTDYAVSWSYKLPTGGTTHQALLKQSSTNQDAAWTTLSASMVAFSPPSGSTLTSTDVAAALEELSVSGGGSHALSGLTDVAFATGEPAGGDLLYYDGFDWIPRTLSNAGDLSTSQLRNLTITALGTLSSEVIDTTAGDVFSLTPAVDMTLSVIYVPPGAEITLIVTTSGSTSRTLTFGANIKSQGTLATGTVTGKTFAVKFVGDGTNLVEVSRTVAM